MTNVTAETRGLGWVPDLPDQRDFLFQASARTLRTLPSAVDLRGGFPPYVYDQLSLGSCTAQAIAAMIEFNLIKQGHVPFTPSRLFIYYNERVKINTVDSDSGAMLRDGFKSVKKQGAPLEALWPYDIGRFAEKPPAAAYDNALEHQVVTYHRIPRSLRQMKGCLADGYPFAFGFMVYASFYSDQVYDTGIVPMPQADEDAHGGHAVVACGYDDDRELMLVRNSWSDDWADGGYFWMPYKYFTNKQQIARDFWTIKLVEG